MGPGWYWCTPCRRKFTVRVGSIFERSHIPLHKWLLGFRLMAGSKKGFSAHQMHRTLKVDYKTAWFMEHRIRECMDETATAGPLGGEGKIVEADETFLNKQRGRGKWEFTNERGWVKTRDRRSVPVFALVERSGKGRAMPIDNTTSDELRRALKKHADTKSALMTDEWSAYMRPGREFASHESVNHSLERNGRGARPGRRTSRTSSPYLSAECEACISIVVRRISLGTCTNSPFGIHFAPRRSVLKMRSAPHWQSKAQSARDCFTKNLITRPETPPTPKPRETYRNPVQLEFDFD